MSSSGGKSEDGPSAAVPRQPPTPAATPPEFQAFVFYLFDVSRSMHNGKVGSPYEQTIPLLRQSIEALSGGEGLPMPQVHRVGTIGDMSLQQTPLCQVAIGGGVF